MNSVWMKFMIPRNSLVVPMNRNRQNSISSQRVHALMRVLFVVFTFLYFYCCQTPLLALVQHQLSEGQTTYNPIISSLVLTFVLSVVQRLVSTWVRFSESAYFFSYVPSAVMAVLLTAFTPAVDYTILIGIGVAMICFIIAVIYSFVNKTSNIHSGQSFANLLSVHSMGMLGIFLFMGGFSHSNDVLTFELEAARSLENQDYDRALHIGEESLATSNRLTALRAYALSQCECGIGDSLFTFPLAETGARQLLFAPGDTLQQLLPPDSLYAKLEVWPSERETAIAYFERMKERSQHPMAKDYWLTALLLEKDLSKFATELPHYYAKIDSVELPRSYKEALSVYNQENSKPLVFKGDSVMNDSYQQFLDKCTQYDDALIRKNEMRRKYGNTYWWYYYYQD